MNKSDKEILETSIKQDIVLFMLQAARMEMDGFYVENGNRILVDHSQIDEYVKHFKYQATSSAKQLLRMAMADIDTIIE